ncbi:MAG: response regulator transcription factor [Nitrospiraceae bacterium]
MAILKPSVVIADDHPLVTEALREILREDFEVVAVVHSGAELLACAPKLKPDVILLDGSMPPTDGVTVAKEIKAILPNARLLFVTMLSDPSFISDAFRAGAKGYVLKQSAAADLVKAIRTVLKGERYLSPGIPPDVREAVEYPWTKPGGFTMDLTDRQKDILRLLAKGLTTKTIASQLAISPKTVEFHKAGIYKKAGVRSPSELTKFAIAQGLTTL